MGYSRSMFETECERQYQEKLAKAKRQIDNDEYPCYGTIWPTVFGYIDFPSYEANQMVRTWNSKLDNAVELYKSWHENEKAEREAEKEQLRLQKKRLKEEQEAHEAAHAASLRRQYEEEERRKNAERARQREVRRKSSLKTLTSLPYNISEGEAEKYIKKNGEIDESALAKYENAQRNKELLAKKAAEWEAMKHKQQAMSSSSPSICPCCGQPTKNTDRFCRNCGTALLKQCPSCGKLLSTTNKFCTGCGTKL